MFTGIIEHEGVIRSLEVKPTGGRVTIEALSVAADLGRSESIAVNGCCLTVVASDNNSFSADLSGETIGKTTFGVKGALSVGQIVNIEPALGPFKELGGHFVQGHVDSTGRVVRLDPEEPGSKNWWLGIEVPADVAHFIVLKGSIAIDGISLTVARWNPRKRTVEIAVIPYTYEHTNLRDRKVGDAVNLEGDVLGKYVERYLAARNGVPRSSITMERMLEEGF